MSRLTKWLDDKKAICIKECEKECVDGNEWCPKCKPLTDVLIKLADYEDKQEQGLLISVPCKMGDSLYQKRKDGMHEYRVIGLVYDIINKEWLLEVITKVRSEWIKTVCSMDCVGKTSFLTEAEAEEALAKMGGK